MTIPPKPVALSVAGFDPTGATGVLADLKTFAAHDCYGVAAASALGAQNTCEVRRLVPVDSTLLRLEIQALVDDIAVAGVKVGLLGSRRNMEVAAEMLAPRRDAPIVMDPDLRPANDAEGPSASDVAVFAKLLLPLARVLTATAEEAARLLGIHVASLEEMKGAAKLLQDRGIPHVVVKGNHLERPADVYYDGQDFQVFHGHRGESLNAQGAGCTFSSALLANLIHGKAVQESIVLAKAYVGQAIARAYPIGAGRGPLNHLFRFAEAPVRVPGPDLVHEVPHP
jgi:hydroxymethylpyrimidine/phosphomethylpyrimidine kinase